MRMLAAQAFLFIQRKEKICQQADKIPLKEPGNDRAVTITIIAVRN